VGHEAGCIYERNRGKVDFETTRNPLLVSEDRAAPF